MADSPLARNGAAGSAWSARTVWLDVNPASLAAARLTVGLSAPDHFTRPVFNQKRGHIKGDGHDATHDATHDEGE
ncbi:hypothetical protein ACIRPU_41410 [Streptomyces sp. NPDC102259]|uniref:hypothetical protein n=1 Tax=Streptomyces sp. NPDC102259 TaxID=3366148 RepID=UPI0037F71672